MIIVEGPDGAGKTTLLGELVRRLGVKPGPRASASEAGPMQQLAQWVWSDWGLWSWPSPCMAYDRYPLISEYIYGPLVRGSMREGMSHPTMFAQRRRVAQRSLVVLCLPPLDVVRANVGGEVVQMPGVVNQIDAIWSGYDQLPGTWPGWVVPYDYTSSKHDLDSVLRACRLHMSEWEKH